MPYYNLLVVADQRMLGTVATDRELAVSDFGEQLGKQSHLFHEFLEEENAPFYFSEVMADARRHGLKFLAEADIVEMETSRFAH